MRSSLRFGSINIKNIKDIVHTSIRSYVLNSDIRYKIICTTGNFMLRILLSMLLYFQVFYKESIKEIYYVELLGTFRCPTASKEKHIKSNCEFVECYWESYKVTLVLFTCGKVVPSITCLSYDESGFNKDYCIQQEILF